MSCGEETRFWRSPEEGCEGPAPDLNEDIRRSLLELPVEGLSASRRSFLRLAGFGLAAGATACSRGAVQKAIPYLNPPEQIVPGRSYQIASTCSACPAGCGILAKGRDGRPVKVEGSPDHPLSRGGLCAAGQADLLALYDSHRLDGPLAAGEATTWDYADQAVGRKIEEVRRRGGRVRLLTGTITSPSTLELARSFLGRFQDGRHVTYDALSVSAFLDAYASVLGRRLLPRIRLDRAAVVASFGADFLGTWTSPVEHAAGWREARVLEGEEPRMSRVVQLESRLSLTGTVADRRLVLAPWETEAALAALCARLAERSGEAATVSVVGLDGTASGEIGRLADELWSHRGESLVLCGANDHRCQVLCACANDLLGNHGRTLDLARPSLQRQGSDAAVEALREELAAGEVDLLVTARCNPAYDLPDPAGFAGAMAQAGLTVACSSHLDETASAADLVLPEPHGLESWDDAEPVAGLFGLRQPSVRPLRDARTLRATLGAWTGDQRGDPDILRDHWRRRIFVRQKEEADFDRFFAGVQQAGFVDLPDPAAEPPTGFWREAVLPPRPVEAPAPGALALVLHPKVGLGDGAHAHNPWLQELPDPVSKVVWDNYASLAPAAARRLGLEEGEVVGIVPADGGAALELPVHLQPGQHEGVVAVALGYGRKGTDRFAAIGPEWLQSRPTVEEGALVGRNAAPLLGRDPAGVRFEGTPVRLEPTGRRADLACTQAHHRLEVPPNLAPARGARREAILATTFAAWQEGPEDAVHRPHHPHGDLWPEDHPQEGPRWGLAVDLSACTGCSACVIACQAENNVPVVGKDEVRRHREMHWIRIDRYYRGSEEEAQAWHQPMMCQHCDRAPCETVCPVLATVHSREGLNQQVYNRCVGTRYCANNCPYKVRRFNWFDYSREDQLRNMALNPDVTIRRRGVMEKCSLCAQRILAGRIEARRRGEPLADGQVQTACQQTCPTRAIVFGDLNDPESRVARLAASHRAYGVLEELNVRPSVRYLAAVRNPGGGEGARSG